MSIQYVIVKHTLPTRDAQGFATHTKDVHLTYVGKLHGVKAQYSDRHEAEQHCRHLNRYQPVGRYEAMAINGQ